MIRSPWDDGRLDGEGPDQFGPGDDPPALYHVKATVVDTKGLRVAEGETFEALFGTASRTESYAIQRAEMFFQGNGFEVVSDYKTDRTAFDKPRVQDVFDHVRDLKSREDMDTLSWI